MSRLVCRTSGESYPIDDPRWRSDGGGLLDLQFAPTIDPDRIQSGPPTLWRYRDALPVADDDAIVSFGEGMTPLSRVEIAGFPVLMKLDFLFPSGSYKDRGATVLVSHAKSLRVRQVVVDSSGNAGAAIAQYCAQAGIGCEVFVPAHTSPAKLYQMTACGARVTKVPGPREESARAAMSAAEHTFYASHVFSPFFLHGTKTFAFEVCEQLGWQAPDTVVLPAGNGTLVLGAAIGFSELKAAGVISQLPKIVAVQASGCAPLCEAFARGIDKVPEIESQETVAEGIAIARPPRGPQILEAVRQTGGTFVAVTEPEIIATHGEMCRQGYFIEPTSAAVVAGLKQYVRDEARPGEVVVSVFTGSGLKSAKGEP